MNKKILSGITLAIILIIAGIVVGFPRPVKNRFYVESIIDYNKGINVHYPKTGNDHIDNKIYSFVSHTIREHEESGKRDGLISISFDCHSSFFTVIHFTVKTERKSSTRGELIGKAKHKLFFTLEKGDIPASAAISGNSQLRTPDFLKGKKLVALTFDDGPSEHTATILNTLDRYGVKGTFCILGTKVQSHKSTIEIMHSSGHEIANHTFNHQKLTSLEDDEMIKEIQSTQDAIHEITGQYPRFLRPTYGAFNSRVRSNINMPILMWNKDTLDWKSRNADYIFNQAVNSLDDGDIILFHDIYPTTAQAIDKLIPYILKNGYYPVTVSELFALKGLTPEEGKAYFSPDNAT